MHPASLPAHSSLNVLPYRAILQHGDPQERQSMVMALFESGRGEAQAVLRQALRDPDERIRLLAAQALERAAESFQKSAQAQRRAIENNPLNARLKVALARLLFDRGVWGGHLDAGLASFEEAEQLLSAALAQELSPVDRDAAWALLGRSRAKLGRATDARAALDRVPASAPDYVAARIAWAETRLADGDIAAAREEMRRLAALSPSPEVAEAARFWESGS